MSEHEVSGLPFIITGPPEYEPDPDGGPIGTWSVPIIGDHTAPTLAELRAGLDLTWREPTRRESRRHRGTPWSRWRARRSWRKYQDEA